MTKNEQIAELLTRGVEEVIDKKHLEQRLQGKKKFRVKLGIDPTSPNIHIGRAVSLWKLRAFQELGHTAIFIVGDFTGRIGDTSDKESERPMLTVDQVKKNMKTYFDQAFKILDKSKTEAYYNSEWLEKLGFLELARMASLFGLHEFESREVIARRMKVGQRVTFHELMYPLMQGYDSVAVRADVELGGTDQRFNLLAGRTIQKLYNQEPQDIVMTTLLEGTDGRKMSSSWGNVINLTDTPKDMFGKVMTIQDNLLEKYFFLATRTPVKDISNIVSKHANPRDAKLVLARTITEQYHGKKLAEEAEAAFIAQFSKKKLPTDIPEHKVTAGTYAVIDLLVHMKLAASKSEARRLVEQGGVRVNGEQIKKERDVVIKEKNNNLLIQVGKRKFVKIK